MEKQGILFVVSAPSGTGKTTLCREMTIKLPNLTHSVSYTTRSPRADEVDGREYLFVNETRFREMIERNEFAEWAEVHGNLYGTHNGHLLDIMNRGEDILLDIDSQGAIQMKKRFKDGVFIYILPPSFEVLKSRLTDRGSESTEEIRKRLKKAKEEIWNYREYYYIVVNDDFKKAL
ncbi:MAG TPA: guanylate kinase, partial [Nitrospiria bacterium]|nr:guanylate kinase [Nitrospiria bacterium]